MPEGEEIVGDKLTLKPLLQGLLLAYNEAFLADQDQQQCRILLRLKSCTWPIWQKTEKAFATAWQSAGGASVEGVMHGNPAPPAKILEAVFNVLWQLIHDGGLGVEFEGPDALEVREGLALGRLQDLIKEKQGGDVIEGTLIDVEDE